MSNAKRLRAAAVIITAMACNGQDHPTVPDPAFAAAVERGRALFAPKCGFCHGNDATGKSGPDLVRSKLVLHDENGNLIGPVVRAGRPSRGMPAFAGLTDEQVSDIAAFLHSRASAAKDRLNYEIKGVLTGDAKEGEAFFNGAGGCKACHSPTGDLQGIAKRYQPVDLQKQFLYPVPSFQDYELGRKTGPLPRPTAVVTLPSGQTVKGVVEHIDEFNVAIRDAEGWYRTWPRDSVKLELHDPLEAHRDLLPRYTDADMHNMLAYLETLK